jgi:hypothetical protein
MKSNTAKFKISMVLASILAFSVPETQAQTLFEKLKKATDGIAPNIISPDAQGGDGQGSLSLGDITSGLKEALRVGAERVVEKIGAAGGYNDDAAIHIPLPEELQTVQSTLRKFGLSGLADDVELKLNRAAEAAAPKTKQILWDSVTNMTLDDAKRIYDGPSDAATQYFRRVSSANLKDTIKPVVDQTLNQVGAIAAYDNLMSEYKSVPFVPDVKANLSQHTVDLALSGIFHYLAKEEAAIRENPAKRTTELLSKVFGN